MKYISSVAVLAKAFGLVGDAARLPARRPRRGGVGLGGYERLARWGLHPKVCLGVAGSGGGLSEQVLCGRAQRRAEARSARTSPRLVIDIKTANAHHLLCSLERQPDPACAFGDFCVGGPFLGRVRGASSFHHLRVSWGRLSSGPYIGAPR